LRSAALSSGEPTTIDNTAGSAGSAVLEREQVAEAAHTAEVSRSLTIASAGGCPAKCVLAYSRASNARRRLGRMHAVVVRVTINDSEPAERELREQVVPRVSQAPGFVSGYWTRKDNAGLSMILFDSEDAATRASEMIPTAVPEHVTLEGVEVREVVAQA
jgi:hypothetical protein